MTENASFQDIMLKGLGDCGLWPSEALEVIQGAKKESAELKSIKWNDPADAYPAALWAVCLLSLRSYALNYLKETKPLHFAIHFLEELASEGKDA